MNGLPAEQSFGAGVGVCSLAPRQGTGFVADARHDPQIKFAERFGDSAIVGDDEQDSAAWNRALNCQSKRDSQIARIHVTVCVEAARSTALETPPATDM